MFEYFEKESNSIHPYFSRSGEDKNKTMDGSEAFSNFPRPWNAVLSSIEWTEIISVRRAHKCASQKSLPSSRTDPFNSRHSTLPIPAVIFDCACGRTGQNLETFVKTSLRALSHPLAELTRLVEFLAELVPFCQRSDLGDGNRG